MATPAAFCAMHTQLLYMSPIKWRKTNDSSRLHNSGERDAVGLPTLFEEKSVERVLVARNATAQP